MTIQTKTITQKIGITISQPFKDTIALYQDAVTYLMNVMDSSLPDLSIYNNNSVISPVERLVHQTKANPTPAFSDFDDLFYKFPSYLRRAAIASAFGKLSSYRSNHERWFKERQQAVADGKSFHKKPPTKQFTHDDLPVLYKGNMFIRESETTAKVKVYNQNDWVWLDVSFQAPDLLKRGVVDWKECNPKLVRKGKHYFLAFSYQKNIKLHSKPIEDQRICAVDMGLTNSAVCAIMDAKGTVIARRFINQAIEKDHLRQVTGHLKQRQRQSGKIEAPRYWNRINGLQKQIKNDTAHQIIAFAQEQQVDTIVFEYLGNFRSTKSSKGAKRLRERLHYWAKQGIQNKVEEMAHYHGMRIARVNPNGTSKQAYDGSGLVKRNHKKDMAVFPNGKVYHADLNASYNIGARYYIKQYQKATPETEWLRVTAKVPSLAFRTQQTLSTLITLRTEAVSIGAAPVASGVC